MSLTSILNSSNHKPLKEKLRLEFPKPILDNNVRLKQPPTTVNYGIIGTAFDYLVRFHLEANKETGIIHKNELLALRVLNRLLKKIERKEGAFLIFNREGNEVFGRGLSCQDSNTLDFLRKIGYNIVEKNALRNSLLRSYSDFNNAYLKFQQTKKETTDLFEGSIFLAKLDIYFRAGVLTPLFVDNSSEDVADLINLFKLYKKQKWSFKENCFLNPTFGKGSLLVGGADADIILDDTLIDIKVTNSFELERRDFNQVICYYLLSEIGGINKYSDLKPVKYVGIYFARHGYLWKMPISELGDSQKLQTIKKWFIGYFQIHDF